MAEEPGRGRREEWRRRERQQREERQRREEQERTGQQQREQQGRTEQQQRDFDLLKHLSTLNVATIVLLVTLSKRDILPTTGKLGLPLAAFSFSLLAASAGLLYYVAFLGGEDYGEGTARPSFAITSALVFFVGVVLLLVR